jgi:hypothetical protein
VNWSVSDDTLAAVDAAGLLTAGTAVGSFDTIATATGTADSISGSLNVELMADVMAAISVRFAGEPQPPA